ncbi:glycosyl hydrolase family 28-related protein [Taibaiella koreensis]|uniref:glycosyl hydrolase family 28-related protein n=1 Tax=Taibaiella koreensis TaxID=1268548 RepID=UPI0013C33506|nr:glycosyl hydrolase family 28-related protein [Taibaiella koreensis]
MAVLNVKDYGAIGDGLTDDTPAFVNALNDLNNVYEKGYLYCPSGTYVIHQQLEIKKPFIGIKGDGIQTTALQFAGSGLKLNPAATGFHDFSFAVVEELTINGPGLSGSGYNSIGIDIPEGNFYFLSRFLIQSFDIGINAVTAVLSKFSDFSITNCKIGAKFRGGSNATSIINGNIRGCTEIGIDEKDSISFFISNTDIEAIGDKVAIPGTDPVQYKYLNGVSIKTAGYMNIRDCHFETSETVLGLAAGNCEVLMQDSFIYDCTNGIKQLDPTLSGRFTFLNLMFLSVDTEFDIPDTNLYRIENITSRLGTSPWWKEPVINANPKKGVVHKVLCDGTGYIDAGMMINGKEVETAYKFSDEIAVGVIPANSTVTFSVTTPPSIKVSEWGDVVQSAIVSYTVPPGLLWNTSIHQFTLDTIVLNITNTTGTAINVGTRIFRFNITTF